MHDSPEGQPPSVDIAGLASLISSSTTVGYLTATLEGEVLGHNLALGLLCGAPDVTGRALTELLVPGDRSRAVQAVQEVASGVRASLEVVLRLRRPGAEPPRVVVTLTRVDPTDGAAPHLAALLLDDTERHEKATIVAQRVRRTASLLRALPDAVLICAADGTVLEVNDQAEALFGYRAVEMVGRPVELLVPTHHVAVHRWKREEYTPTPHARRMSAHPDVTARHKDGHDIPVEVDLAEAQLEFGTVTVVCARDVTVPRARAVELRDSRHLVEGILSAATEQAILATDLQGNIQTFSRGAELMLGYSADEVVGQPAFMFTPPEVREQMATVWGLSSQTSLQERVDALVRARAATTRPWVFLTKSGERRHVLLSITVRMVGDAPGGLILVATDQSERLAREAERAAGDERLRTTFERAPIGVALISVDPATLGRFLQVNLALERSLGYERQELLDATVMDLTAPEDLPLLVSVFDRLAAGNDVTELVEHRLLHADGHAVWMQASLATVVGGGDGSGPYVIAMITDITARRRAEDELSHHTFHDPLTGLPNRALITEQLAQALARGRRSGTGVGVLYLDLDNFKDVNDSLGHAAGDELLVGVAHRLAGSMDDANMAARLGGDEFVVVCEDLASVDELTAIADRAAQALAIQLPVAGQMITVSASIGIAYTATSEGLPADLLREADIAMYRAKGNGRARYEFSDPQLQVRALRQIELEADLRATLSAQHAEPAPDLAVTGMNSVRRPQEGRLFLVYQPCFSALTGRLAACEALLRWDHPTRGVLAPGQFLDVAEDRALMSPLGTWVLQDAAAQAAVWQNEFGDDAPDLWVNISAGQMGRNRFSSRVADVLGDTGLAPAKLWLELTERQALSSAHSVLDDLQALPDMGVRLAIDDFGTGYAGMDLLRRLPVSALKIDASYVAAIGHDPTGAALVSTVVGLGAALNLQVVAEGVETEKQRASVTTLGVDVLQGYLLARPGPVEQVEEILRGQVVVGG